MASDLSTIIQTEISATLEKLLSQDTKIEECSSVASSSLDGGQCVKISTKFNFASISSIWDFFIPTKTAAQFEYLMLGGIGEHKENIDDEISDAVKEIVSNICGSMTTSINAQGFEDLSNLEFSLDNSEIIQCDASGDLANLFKFNISLGDDTVDIYISFDDAIMPNIIAISGGQAASESSSTGDDFSIPSMDTDGASGGNSAILQLLGEESIDNLKLLFDIKLKLQVRLGTKIFLLKDILKWDIGEIIELDQMVNESLAILVNGVKVGEGEAVVVDGKFGLKIKYIGDKRGLI